jgi:NAD(P)-dependent dehydrogenase (short-subunit alcohol dehydrogenase family)
VAVLGTARRLNGKVVLVTGSTRGVGEAVARRCAVEGARVVVTGRTVELGQAVAASIREDGGEALFLPVDVTREADIAGAFEQTLAEWSRVDGIVANAANLSLGALDGPVTEVTLDAWNQLISADLTSVFLTAKHGLRAILQGGQGGAVVTIGSLSGIRGTIGHDAYSAAKGGIVALTRSIAAYYARYAIRCNCLSLGFVDSGSDRVEQVLRHPGFRDQLLKYHLGSWGRGEDIGGLVATLLSDDGRYVNGANIPVDGGAYAASHMPRPTVVAEIPGFPPLQIAE